ncbi:hypothetical protein [Mesorhizobium marinum]|uniref:Uncharacterized protein n=1 Tax=Mesorhizobium marinum TaxID=3228790 RepID=A0ABV3QZN7_9HYPH
MTIDQDGNPVDVAAFTGLVRGDIPELALPPEAQDFSQKHNRWYAAYSFRQYLYQDPSNPAEGWGNLRRGRGLGRQSECARL